MLPVPRFPSYNTEEPGASLRFTQLNMDAEKTLPAVYPGTPVPFAWKRMVELKVATPAITNKELGKELGVNAQTIAMWEAKAEYQRYENWVLRKAPLEDVPVEIQVGRELERDMAPILRARAETYLEEMQDRLLHILRTTESEKLQAEIIFDQFDRAGFVSLKTLQRVTPIVMTPEAMREFFTRAQECGLLPESGQPGQQPAVEGEVLSKEEVA